MVIWKYIDIVIFLLFTYIVTIYDINCGIIPTWKTFFFFESGDIIRFLSFCKSNSINAYLYVLVFPRCSVVLPAILLLWKNWTFFPYLFLPVDCRIHQLWFINYGLGHWKEKSSAEWTRRPRNWEPNTTGPNSCRRHGGNIQCSTRAR